MPKKVKPFLRNHDKKKIIGKAKVKGDIVEFVFKKGTISEKIFQGELDVTSNKKL